LPDNTEHRRLSLVRPAYLGLEQYWRQNQIR